MNINIWVKLLRTEENKNRQKCHNYFYFVPKINLFLNLNQVNQGDA